MTFKCRIFPCEFTRNEKRRRCAWIYYSIPLIAFVRRLGSGVRQREPPRHGTHVRNRTEDRENERHNLLTVFSIRHVRAAILWEHSLSKHPFFSLANSYDFWIRDAKPIERSARQREREPAFSSFLFFRIFAPFEWLNQSAYQNVISLLSEDSDESCAGRSPANADRANNSVIHKHAHSTQIKMFGRLSVLEIFQYVVVFAADGRQ